MDKNFIASELLEAAREVSALRKPKKRRKPMKPQKGQDKANSKQYYKQNKQKIKKQQGKYNKKTERSATLDESRIARELEAIGQGLTRNVDVGRRNIDKNRSNTSFAPAISSKLRKKAVEGLERHNRELDLNPSDLKREWSAYYTYIDDDQNNNKYHYYVVYSYEHLDGDTRYVGWNCSGRIGILERAYDLTLKHGRSFPAYSVNEAKAALNKHLRVKTRKGYELTKMTRG